MTDVVDGPAVSTAWTPATLDRLLGPDEATRRRRLRRLGAGLVLHGAVGLVALVAGATLVLQTFGDLETLTGSLGTQRGSLQRALETTSLAVADAADAASGFDESLVAARTSAERAGDLTRDVGATMRQVGTAARFEILGTRPLGPLAASFERAGGQLDELGDDIDAMASALGRNEGDLAVIADDLRTLRSEIDALTDGVPAAAGVDGLVGSLNVLRVVLLVLVAWLLVPAVTGLAAGWWLWRAASRRG